MCLCVCACAALGIHHVMRMRHIVIRGPPRYIVFSTLLKKRDEFRKKS